MEAGPGPAGAPRGSGFQAPVPRQGGAAGHGLFDLVYQVAGDDSSYDFYRDELVQPGAWGQSGPSAYECMARSDHMGQTDYARAFGDTCAPDDSTWGYFPPTSMLAVRSQGIPSCWNPACDRVHTGTYWYAL